MAHIDVAAPAVKKKTAVAGGFVPITIVQIDQAIAVMVEKPVADAREHILDLGRRLDETPVLGLQPCNSLPHILMTLAVFNSLADSGLNSCNAPIQSTYDPIARLQPIFLQFSRAGPQAP